MQIEIEVDDAKAAFFLEYLHSLKEGIIENIVIKEKPAFLVSDVKEVVKRVTDAEKRAAFSSHEDFWAEVSGEKS